MHNNIIDLYCRNPSIWLATKATPILGEGVPVDSRNFRVRVEGSNLNGLFRSWYR